jgi:hypothetical protein
MEFRIVNRPNFTKKSLHLTYFRGKVGGLHYALKGKELDQHVWQKQIER